MGIVDKETCERNKKHNTKVFTSCFPQKRFCYFCMEELKYDGEKNEN